jgi:hyaluronoglucosaminidase
LDVAAYGRSEAALGAAQADLVRRVESELAAKHPGTRRLFVVPTAYSGTMSNPYKKALARGLPKDVLVQWTGRSGISARITGAEAAEAAAVYAHPLVVWSNFFVNDYLPGSLILGPLTGHKPSLAQQTAGITADPLNEPEASKIGLFTVADYAWNPSGYLAARSWRASLAELSQNGAGAAALATIAGANMTPPAASLDAAPECWNRSPRLPRKAPRCCQRDRQPRTRERDPTLA